MRALVLSSWSAPLEETSVVVLELEDDDEEAEEARGKLDLYPNIKLKNLGCATPTFSILLFELVWLISMSLFFMTLPFFK